MKIVIIEFVFEILKDRYDTISINRYLVLEIGFELYKPITKNKKTPKSLRDRISPNIDRPGLQNKISIQKIKF